MNVYDFDKTIYNGNSEARFFLFCVIKKPTLLKFLPTQIWAALKYLVGAIDKTSMKQEFYRMLRGIENVNAMADAFWDAEIGNIKKWYLSQKRADDLIISASTEFLLRPICERLGITNLIASRVDAETGSYEGENCYGEEKVERFRKIYGGMKIEDFYSDSYSDAPLARLAERAYMVKGEKIRPWFC